MQSCTNNQTLSKTRVRNKRKIRKKSTFIRIEFLLLINDSLGHGIHSLPTDRHQVVSRPILYAWCWLNQKKSATI